MKRKSILIGFGALVIVILLARRISSNGVPNIAAIQVVKQMQPIEAHCAPLDAEWIWNGMALPKGTSAYLRAATLSIGAQGITEGQSSHEQYEPRLLAWFQALQLARHGQAADSMPYFKMAGVGQVFLAAGHKTYLTDSVCTAFNWVLAHEIGNVGPSPDPPLANVTSYVEGLIANGQAQAVIEAYTRLLTFAPNKNDWRLTLAKAYLTVKQTSMAEHVLQPLLASPEGRAAAEALLNKYPK